MKCVVGLGNPGQEYLLTRHNIGFMLIDSLGGSGFQKKQSSFIKKVCPNKQEILLVKPQSYMNLSGKAVKKVLDFYKIAVKDLLVIQDDLDMRISSLKFQKNRGTGGHNGILSLHSELKTVNYTRLKMGIGNPLDKESDFKRQKNKDSFDVADIQLYKPFISSSEYVLSPFSDSEQAILPDFLSFGCQAVLFFLENGFEKAAGKYNGKTAPSFKSE